MLLCVCMLLLVASDLGFCLDEASLDDQWKQWKIKYGKEYNSRRPTGAKRSYRSSLQQPSEDEEYRRAIWEKNMLMIEAHNREAEQGKHSYTLGMNFLGDMASLNTEAKSSYCKGQTTRFFYKTGVCNPEDFKDETLEEKVYNMTYPLKKLPKYIDYREKGMVTRVKYQGSCGSCWAFSAAGALEGQLAKKTGQLVDLSAQNLLYCAAEKNCSQGGHMLDAFEYVRDNGGMNPEEDYPYVEERQQCRFKKSAIRAQCKGFKEAPKGDEFALAEALYNVGPLSVAIDSRNIMFYESGVYYDPKCDENNPVHAVLLVGYGETAKGLKYWIVKNSYGENWGENGYFRIARDHDNHCGIATDASYPLM